ncbi:rod shape-determining protein MreC [Edaphobacter bradus]|uniref:rod shape-determining protein MreC n=1 Tax=Edaphobacter bradus TaxID=2259016 RepID=UPI0021E0DA8F|nr:rod shape-determining protein MreC [Edaphobacter bradus]
MESFFTRYKNVLVLVVVLLVQTIALAIQVKRPVESGAPDGNNVTLLRHWVVAVMTPAERFFHGIGHGVRGGWSNYVDLRRTRQQNRELTDEVARLRLEEAELAEDAMQGHRLQSLLSFQHHYVASTVAAQVIGSSGSDMSRVLYLDKGAKDGLKPDQAVITPDGIVGKLRDVFPRTAQVLLINDSTSGAGVLLETTRIRGILRGSLGGAIQINNLTADARIKPGEQVLTSGGDQVFPRGLRVGTIESITPDPDHQPYTLIRVKPAVNLFQLEEVLVITGTQPDLPAESQKDLAQGLKTAQEQAAAKTAADEAAAEAAARTTASQIVAERLPSLNNGQDANVAKTPAGATPGGTVPKPRPTLHPDRYTPGATPPASSLTPGGATPAPPAPTVHDEEPSSQRKPQPQPANQDN